MARIKTIEPLVYRALTDNPLTRTDDFILVLEVLKNKVTEEMTLKTVLEHHTELGIPSFASIMRTRRKLQEKYPELKNKATAEMRAEAEKDFREYALNS